MVKKLLTLKEVKKIVGKDRYKEMKATYEEIKNKCLWDEIIREFHLATQQVPIGAPPLIFECWLVENYQPPKKK